MDKNKNNQVKRELKNRSGMENNRGDDGRVEGRTTKQGPEASNEQRRAW